MSIDTLENVLTLLVVIMGSLYSLFKYVRAPKREWLYLSVFFLSHMLSDYYWTAYTVVMGENPDVSAFIAYFGWNVGYTFLLVLAIKMRTKESTSYFHPLILVPIPLGIVQFLIYIQYGGILNNIWEGFFATAVFCLCLQPICYYVKHKKEGASVPWFSIALCLHIVCEYGMWTSSCYDWPSVAFNPYYYFSYGDCVVLALLWIFMEKSVSEESDLQNPKSRQEIRVDVFTQISIAIIIILGSAGGYTVAYRMKSSLENGSIKESNIAWTLFLVSVALVLFALVIITMTAARYKSMSEKSEEAEPKYWGRMNLGLTILVTFILMTASVFYTSLLFYRVSYSGAMEDGEARVQAYADELENYLIVARSVLGVTADTVEVMLKNEEPQEKIVDYIYLQTKKQASQFDENFTGLYAYIDGEYMDGSGWQPQDNYVVEERDWYKAAVKANGDTVIVSPYVDADTGSLVITICKLLNDGGKTGDDQKRNVVALDMVVNSVQEMTEAVDIGGKGYAMVVNYDGMIVSHPDISLCGKNFGEIFDRDLLAKVVSNDSKTIRTTIDGEKNTLFTRCVLNKWYVVIVVSDAELLEETKNQLGVNVVVSLIVFLLITFFYYLGYKNDKLNAQRMEAMRSRTLKKEYEAQVLRQKKDAADVANRAKSSFLAQMSHEIRTPINAVLGMNEMILRKSEDEEILEYADNIDSAGNTLLALINSILDFSKIEDGKMDIIPVNYHTVTLIQNIVNSVSQRAEAKGLELKVDVDTNLPSILFGDDVRITQVIMNLMTNAVKYTEKGSVTLSVKKQERNKNHIKLFVSVKDTGIGIKPEDMDKLLVSFARIEEKRNRNIEGTGLGMSIVSSLLNMMGSEIKVQSTYGEGSEFSFVLDQEIIDVSPIGSFERATETKAKRRTNEDLISAPSARILVCDDNALNRKVANNLLKLCEIHPDLVSSGKDALSMVEVNDYDIVFLDHMMPGMDGIETLHEMRDKSLVSSNTKIIVLTANAVLGAREEYFKEGFDDYLSKPMVIDSLIEILKKYLPQRAYEKERDLAKEPKEEDSGFYRMDVLMEAGVDVETGLSYCANDIETYYEILDLFVKTFEKKFARIQELYDQKDWKEYRVFIHALKSDLRTLGLTEGAEKAFAMEKAADEKDEAYITAHHTQMQEEYERIVGLIRAVK